MSNKFGKLPTISMNVSVFAKMTSIGAKFLALSYTQSQLGSFCRWLGDFCIHASTEIAGWSGEVVAMAPRSHVALDLHGADVPCAQFGRCMVPGLLCIR